MRITPAEILFTENTEVMDDISAFVSGGGTLPEFCEMNGVRYGVISTWINKDEARVAQYAKATVMRAEWFEQTIFRELRGIATLDIRDALAEDGTLKPVSEWSVGTAKALAGIDIEMIKDMSGDGDSVGRVGKIKLLDKLRALELLMKNRKMLTDKVEHSGTMTLEQLVAASNAAEDPIAVTVGAGGERIGSGAFSGSVGLVGAGGAVSMGGPVVIEEVK